MTPEHRTLTTAQTNIQTNGSIAEPFEKGQTLDRLVLLGWAIADLTPAAYLRGYLPRVLLSEEMGDLILRWASHLDAFSAYPLPTQLPSIGPWRNHWYTGGWSVPVLSY